MAKLADVSQEMADRLELPAEMLKDVPKITIAGRRRVLIENHGGIVRYSSELIELGGGTKVVIRGDGLRLVAMDRRDMVIAGRILSAEYE
jgi:sporulation protein YqfC